MSAFGYAGKRSVKLKRTGDYGVPFVQVAYGLTGNLPLTDNVRTP